MSPQRSRDDTKWGQRRETRATPISFVLFCFSSVFSNDVYSPLTLRYDIRALLYPSAAVLRRGWVVRTLCRERLGRQRHVSNTPRQQQCPSSRPSPERQFPRLTLAHEMKVWLKTALINKVCHCLTNSRGQCLNFTSTWQELALFIEYSQYWSYRCGAKHGFDLLKDQLLPHYS